MPGTIETATCSEQMRKFEEDWRKENIEYRSVPLVWQMTKNDYNNVFLKNKQIAELYKSWANANFVAVLQNYGPNNAMFLKSVVDLNGLSSIEIVDEVEHNKRFDGTVTEIRGWQTAQSFFVLLVSHCVSCARRFSTSESLIPSVTSSWM